MSDTPDRSLAGLVRDIGGNVDRIVRAEIRHAVAEVRERTDAASEASRFLIGGVVCAQLAAGFLLLSLLLGLGYVMPLWLAALLIALAVGAAGVALLSSGRARYFDRINDAPPEASSILGPKA